MINVSNQLKIDCESNRITYREYIIINNEEIDIKGKMFQTAYKDTHFIGTFNLNYIKFSAENNIQYRNKEFDYYKEVNGNSFKIGHYIVTEIRDSDTNEEVEVTAYDNGIKFANKYESDLDYTSGAITLMRVLQECCTKCGVNLKNESITNGNFIVDSNQFTSNEQYGDVISAIAYMSGDFATINADGELEFIFYKETNEIIKDYIKLEDKRDTHKITCVALGLSNVEGENVVLKDDELIELYGENWLIINDNPFAYTQEKRTQLIQAIFDKVKGFGYSSFTANYSFKPYYQLGDKIQIRNKAGELVDSIVLRIETNYDDITLSAPSITDATVEYQQPLSAINLAKQTEIIVDKERQTINSIVSKANGIDSSISNFEQTFDYIFSKVSNTIDITTNAQSNYGIVNLTEINKSQPIEIRIHPINQSISYLYPSLNTFPSANTFLKIRTLRFKRTYVEDEETKTENIDYVIPDNLLFYNSETYDEFILDYNTNTCQVIKRCGYNTDGTIKKLTTEVVENFEYPEINLEDGDYEISLLGYSFGFIYAKLMKQNSFTDEFATKVEMNSAIEQKANEITSTVSETYTTKADSNTEARRLESLIDQTADQVSIDITQKITEDGVTKVVTNTGYKFDDTGMHIDKAGAETKSTINEKGIIVEDATGSSNESLLYAGYDDDTGETLVKTKNLTVQKYLTIGTYSRIEDYEQGTGVFWIGG